MTPSANTSAAAGARATVTTAVCDGFAVLEELQASAKKMTDRIRAAMRAVRRNETRVNVIDVWRASGGTPLLSHNRRTARLAPFVRDESWTDAFEAVLSRVGDQLRSSVRSD